MNLKKFSSLGFAALLSVGGMSAASAADLLNVDLSVPNQITITTLPGSSAVSVSGGTSTGFYFANFFSGTGSTSGSAVLPGANLTAASVATDNSPVLFRAGSTDGGLNVWSYSATSTTTFTAGVQAFAGSATWTVSPAFYGAAVAGGTSVRSLYFPADDVGDLTAASLLGTYTVTAVPEPATVALMGLGALGLLVARRRHQSRA